MRMDITFIKISKEFLSLNIQEFISLLNNIPNEYWNKDCFLLDLDGKWENSIALINNNKILGYIIASIKDNNLHIHKFMIHSDFRSKGLGKVLFDQFIKINKKDFDNITLKLYSDNVGAKKFYWKLGFEITEINNELLFGIKKLK